MELWKTTILTFLGLNEAFPDVQGDVGCAIQNYVGDRPPGIGREPFRGGDEISGRVVDHHLRIKEHAGFRGMFQDAHQPFFQSSREVHLLTSGSPTSLTS